MNKYFICFIILLFNYVFNDCTNGDGTNCREFTNGDSKCIPNLAKNGCEIAVSCGSGPEVPAGNITTDYCSNLKVNDESDTCIPNLAKTNCEIAEGCGSGTEVPEGTITTDYCSNLKVTGGSGKCIPNIAKTNCEIAPSCGSGNAVPAGNITTDYCDSLRIETNKLCIPNGDRSNCKIAESCREVTTKATDSICKSLTVSDKDKIECIKDGEKCIEKNKNESRALRFSLLLFIFTLLY